MAQISGELFTSTTVGKKESIVDAMFELDPMNVPFLTTIGAGPDGALNTLQKPATQPTHSWLETSLTTNRTTLNTAMTSAQTTMDLTDADWLRASDRVLVDIELIDITTVAAGQPSVVVRGVGGTTAAAHVLGAVVVNLGIARAQGTGLGTALADQPTLITNQMQIFKEDVDVAGSVLATEAYGRRNEYDANLAQVMRRLKEQLEHAVLFSGDSVAAVAGSTAGRMAGGLDYITSNIRSLASAQLQKDDVLRVLESIYNAGGQADMLLCGSFNASLIDSWKDSAIRYTSNEATNGGYGATVGRLDTRFGMPNVVVKRSFPQSLVMLVTTANVGVGPLSGNGATRGFEHVEVGVEGDRKKGFVVGEYTCEWRLQKTHGLITNTAIS